MNVDALRYRNLQSSLLPRTMHVDAIRYRNLQSLRASEFKPFLEIGECSSYKIGDNVIGFVNLTSCGGFSNCTIDFQVMDSSGDIVHEESQNVSLSANVETPILFTWLAGDLPLGDYYSRFLISDWLGSPVLDTGWFFGFYVREPIFVYNFGILQDHHYKNHVMYPSLQLSRGEEAVFNFSLSTCIDSLDLKLNGADFSDFIIEVGNETIGITTGAYLLNGSSTIRIYNAPIGNYSITISAVSLTAGIQEISIETFSKSVPALSEKMSDGSSIVDNIEGVCGTSREYSLEVGYTTNASESIEFSITNSSSGTLLYQEKQNASLFQLNRHVNFNSEFAFPEVSTTYDLTFNLTLTETKESLVWQVKYLAKKAPYEITLKWDAKTTYFRLPASLNLFEKKKDIQVSEESLEALDVSNVTIIDVGIQDSILKNVTVKFQVKNKYVHHFLWMTAYTYYDLYIYPVSVCAKLIEVPKSVVLYNERENVVVSGIPVTYKDGIPTVYFYIQFKKSYWANILDWALRYPLKLILPPGSALSGVSYFTKAAMQFVNIIADYMYSEYSLDDLNKALVSMAESGIEFSESLIRDFGTSDTAEICKSVKPFSLAIHMLEMKNSKSLWKLGSNLICYVLQTFRSKPEVFYRLFRDLELALGADWRTAGVVSLAKVQEVATSGLFALNAMEAVCDCLIDVLFAPDLERKDILASFNTPVPGEFNDIKLGDPMLTITFSGNVSESIFATARHYSIKEFWMNVTTGNGYASFVLKITPSDNYTGVLKSSLSDPNVRSSILSYFGIITENTTLVSDNTALIIQGTGFLVGSFKEFSVHMASGIISGYMQQPFEIPIIDGAGYINLTMNYPFGKDLTYAVGVELPPDSKNIKVLCDGNYTIQDNVITWNTPIKRIEVKFTQGPFHNIATTNITSVKTVAGQGYTIRINATIQNQGDYTETFNVTLYANTTSIATQTVTLTSGNSTTITLTWNTTDFAKGNYTIWAYACPVLGETDTEDNTKTGGTILVSIAGDVNGDHLVDISDLVITVNAIPSAPGWPNWNPNADINGDGVCDISDLVICVGNIPSGPW
jgi:hypothetical protein